MSSPVSTGAAEVWETTTPVGHWSVLSTVDVQDVEGAGSDECHVVADVPSVMCFDDLGIALHGACWRHNFGTPMSHGRVNPPMRIAAWMYEWAPAGAAVSVTG